MTAENEKQQQQQQQYKQSPANGKWKNEKIFRINQSINRFLKFIMYNYGCVIYNVGDI